jgi:hypothetical protein
VGLHPSSLHRRVRKLRRFLEPLRRQIVRELVGDPETLVVDSTLLSVLHPRQVSQSAGFEGAAWVRWGSFSIYGVKLHLLCATNRVLISYELTSSERGGHLPDRRTRRRGGFGRGDSEEAFRGFGLPQRGIGGCTGRVQQTERSRQHGKRQQVEIALASLKREFRLEQTLATTLVGLVTRIAAKVTAYIYGFFVNRLLGRPQGRIKELWA